MTLDPSLHSSFYEQMVEHVFLAEVMQEACYRFGKRVAVLRPEVDNEGYDLVLECNGFLRHVQLKTSTAHATTRDQGVNITLGEKPSGCVIWMFRQEDGEYCRMTLSYLFFGNAPGERLPSLDDFRVGKHTKGNAQGVKTERPAIRRVPKGEFRSYENTRTLLAPLFGLTQEGE